MPTLFIICGVSASGKSTIGRILAEHLDCLFLEGDDFHPAANKNKMKSKIALTDNDRVDWILAISNYVSSLDNLDLVLSCSALTPFVQRELQSKCNRQIHWIKLNLPQEVALQRSKSREHFMPPELINSQYKAWSPPTEGLNVDATKPTDYIVKDIMSFIKNL